jgi:hypothetical protein
MTSVRDFSDPSAACGTYRASYVDMDGSMQEHIPTDELQGHTVRTVLTVALARIQIARRHLNRGNHAETERHLAEIEEYIRRTAETSEIASIQLTQADRTLINRKT